MYPTRVSRRHWLRATSVPAFAFVTGACATRGNPARPDLSSRFYSRRPFLAPRVSEDRVIRTVTGLRPFRPSGFVVRAENTGSKRVVHNFGTAAAA